MILTKPLMTEKAVKLIETENKVIFIVERRATKNEIKKEFEETFDSKIDSIKTHIRKNQKLAIIKLKGENDALNVATKLGMM